jgi:vitamin B12/bleomycin/antimicrobial peptide transport system ATP-binding/permease protein
VTFVCRVLLSKPRLLLMDESTSALDTGNEAALYAALGKSGITYVSVGHRPSLVRHPQSVPLKLIVHNIVQVTCSMS